MESSAQTLLVLSPESNKPKTENESQFFDFQLLHKEAQLPEQFIWPSNDLVKGSEEELDAPIIDIMAIKNDEGAMANAAELVRKACIKHGVFQVTNHGVDQNLISEAHKEFDSIFKLPLSKKVSAGSKNNIWGYSCAHAEKFNTSLPWKETFTIPYKYVNESETQVVYYFTSVLGEELQHTGLVYQKYCDAMKELSMVVLELLAISLGVDGSHFQKFFEDAEPIMRCNSYPPCTDFDRTFGIGPHCDPTALTILHQDQVGGLEIYVDDKWLAVPPRPHTFLINIGDTFTALTNGKYKSCEHRALVNRETERKSMSFFLSPREDKTVIPPESLLEKEEGARKYPNFNWSQLFEFTQKHHRVDTHTLPNFVSWLRSSN